MTPTEKTTVGIRTSLFSRTVLFLTEILNLEIIHYDKEKELAQFKLPAGKTMEVFGPKNLWHPFTTPPDWEVIIADLFVYPLHITGDNKQITPASIGSREEWTNQLRGLLREYRAMGFSSANILDLSAIELSPRLFQATIHWDLRDRAEASLYDFTASYTLGEIGRNLRITAIAHNERPRLRAHPNGESG